MTETQTEYTLGKPKIASTRPIVFVSIPIPLDTLELLEQLATEEVPIENVASLLLADAARAANLRRLEAKYDSRTIG